MRVSLLERGGQKYAVVAFPAGAEQRAQAAFSEALHGANHVSHEAHASLRPRELPHNEPLSRSKPRIL